GLLVSNPPLGPASKLLAAPVSARAIVTGPPTTPNKLIVETSSTFLNALCISLPFLVSERAETGIRQLTGG
ncbi:hypothetical protein, partial [Sinorhizobium fredii]|uniref:hypothetical protein n=1 Tax=Rhizobium fredii TaxID=380 RepID=UPI001AEC0539